MSGIQSCCGERVSAKGLLIFQLALFLTALQAYSRSIFSSLIPRGRESVFFAFYEITDKGSNLIGPVVTIIVHNLTHSYIGVFWYLLFAFGVAAVLLFFMDLDAGMADAGKKESE